MGDRAANALNFSSHLRLLDQSIQQACQKDKINIIADFKLILSTAKQLLKTDEFDFWIDQLHLHSVDEIPTTMYGLDHVQRSFAYSTSDILNRSGMVGRLKFCCEYLFTYLHPDDCCEMQSEFHYYVDLSSEMVFKESKMGVVEPRECLTVKRRVALISDLSVDSSAWF